MTIKVLIIDEQPEVKEPFSDLKKRGFHIHIIHSCSTTLSVLQTIEPDVIIIDSPQPEQTRQQLYANIRAASSAPILVLSVLDEPGIVEKILDRGADEYLIKPVSPNLLTARIKALARRSYSSSEARFSNKHIKTSILPG